MTDKLRRTAPIKITFAKAEQPSSEKLSGLALQTRAALGVVEKAIGDLWNQSGDSLLSDYPIQIPNLARLIGESKFLNPALYPLQSTFKFREKVGNVSQGWTYGKLKFKPKTGSTFAFYNTSGQFTTVKTNEYDVNVAGEYWISTTNGKWRTNDELVGGSEQIEYQVDPLDYQFDSEIFPSIIPDPRHLSGKFSGCRLTKVSGVYYLYLPPRRPLAFTGTDWQDEATLPDKYPHSSDIGLANGNEATTLDTNNLRYWQSDTVDAMDHAHYRYSLPREIIDNYGAMSPGTEYSSNAIYLWDQTTNTILEGVVFRKPFSPSVSSKPWVIEISSASTTLDLDSYLSSPDNESETAYSSTGLTLITCSSAVTRNLWQIITRFLTHQHDNTDVNNSIDHADILFPNPGKDSVYTSNGRYPSYVPAWPQSRWQHDDHTYLLSRTGSQGILSGDQRDKNDNAMLGHLVLANSVADVDDVFLDDSCPDGSFKLAFGSVSGVYIRGLIDRLHLGAAEIELENIVQLHNNNEGYILEVRDNTIDRTTYSYQPIVIGRDATGSSLQNTIEDMTLTVGKGTSGFGPGSTPTTIWVCIEALDLASRRFRRIDTVQASLVGGEDFYTILVGGLPDWAYGYRVYACTTSACNTSSPYWQRLRSNGVETIYYGDYPGGTTPTGTTTPISLDARDPGYVVLADGSDLEAEPTTVVGPLHLYTSQVDPTTAAGAQIQIFTPGPCIFLRCKSDVDPDDDLEGWDIQFSVTDNNRLNLHTMYLDLYNNSLYVPGSISGREVATFEYSASAAVGSTLYLQKARGNYVTRSNVLDEDPLGTISFQGYYSSIYRTFATIIGSVDETPSSDAPGRLSFLTTPVGSYTSVERMRISNDGRVNIVSNLIVGLAATETSPYTPLYTNGINNVFERNNTSNTPPLLSFHRSRGSSGSKSAVSDTDYLGRISFYGYYSGSFYEGARIEAVVNGAVGGTNDMPGALSFQTSPDGSATPVERLKILAEGNVVFQPLASLPTGVEGSVVAYDNSSTTSHLKFHDGNVWNTVVAQAYYLNSSLTTSAVTGIATISGSAVTIPANKLKAGTCVRVGVGGHITSAAGGGTIAIGIRFAGIALGYTQSITCVANDHFVLEVEFYPQTDPSGTSLVVSKMYGVIGTFGTARSVTHKALSWNIATNAAQNITLDQSLSNASDQAVIDFYQVTIS